jgi:hypothetical protein
MTRIALRLIALLTGALLALVASSSLAAPAPAVAVPITADRWTLSADAKIVEHRGVAAIAFPKSLRQSEAVLKDLVFTDGTIELDVEPTTGMGPGVGFRRKGPDTYESFYIRPFPNCATAWDCLQYAPVVRGVLLWDVYPAYQSPAKVVANQWNRLKLVVNGRRLRVYVNGERTLEVDRLEGDAADGAIVLQGRGFVANVTVTPGAVEDLPAEAGTDPAIADGRFVRHWLMTRPATLAADAQPMLAAAPADRAAWTPVEAETGGLVNLTRHHGLPPDQRSLVWLRTTIRAAAATDRRAAIGWNDEVWVFVNGQAVYADKNEYAKGEPRKKPDGRLSLENGVVALPLRRGDNEVVIGVANAFFGWGLMLRLDDAAGVTLARPTR